MTCRDSWLGKRVLILRVNLIIRRYSANFGVHDLLIRLYWVEIYSTLWFLRSWIKLFVSCRCCSNFSSSSSLRRLRLLFLLSWSSLILLAVWERTRVSLINHHLVSTFLYAENFWIGHYTTATCASLHCIGVEQTGIPEILILRLNLLNRFAFVVRVRSVQRGDHFYLLFFLNVIIRVLFFCSFVNRCIAVGGLIDCWNAIGCLVKLMHLRMGKSGPTRLACLVNFDLHFLVYYVYLNIARGSLLSFKL